MKTSACFERVLFHDQTSAANDNFDRQIGQLFEQSQEHSCVDFYVQRPSNRIPDSPRNDSKISEPWSKVSDLETNSQPSTPSPPCHNGDGPPCYTRALVQPWPISDTRALQRFAMVSVSDFLSCLTQLTSLSQATKDCFRIWYRSPLYFQDDVVLTRQSFLHQRHSYSRLQLTS